MQAPDKSLVFKVVRVLFTVLLAEGTEHVIWNCAEPIIKIYVLTIFV